MSRILKLLLASGAGLGLASGIGFAYVQSYYHQPLNVTAPLTVDLLPGVSFRGFTQALADQGVLPKPALWRWRARLTGEARRVQAGEYSIGVGDSPAVLMAKLLNGEVVRYEVKLLEGWTVRQALAELGRQESLIHELEGADESTLLGALGLPEGHSEGLFFPDTYHYDKGTTDSELLRRAYRRMQTELRRAWEARSAGLPYQTAYEALIVASLIEKETGIDEDRPRIAQVFVSRLTKGMRLQTDPSVIYGLGDAFDGNLTRRHLRTDTPYNTYTRRGLTPTPIALTGARSLAAATHPAPGDYLYFVSRGDGSSQFSASLEEHEAAVRKYQLK